MARIYFQRGQGPSVLDVEVSSSELVDVLEKDHPDGIGFVGLAERRVGRPTVFINVAAIAFWTESL